MSLLTVRENVAGNPVKCLGAVIADSFVVRALHSGGPPWHMFYFDERGS